MKDEQWNGGDTPQVAPDARFREDLYRALQETHRQQRVQRQLYGDTSGRSRPASFGQKALTFGAALALLLAVFGFGYYFGRRQSAA